MKREFSTFFVYNRLLSLVFLLNFVFFIPSHAQTQSQPGLPKSKLNKPGIQEELIGGFINKSNLKLGFLNNGRFSPPVEFLPDLPNARFGDNGALRTLDLWIGIPEGPWTPKIWNADSQKYVSLGPTVSGTVFNPSVGGTDWSTINATKGVFYSGEVLFSDVYKPSDLFDFIFAPTSNLEQTWPRDPLLGFREWPGRWRIDPETGEPLAGQFFGDQDVFITFDDKLFADQMYPENTYVHSGSYWDRLSGREFNPQRGYPIGVEVFAQVVGFEEATISNFIIFDLQIVNTSDWNYHDAYLGVFYEADHPVYNYIWNEYYGSGSRYEYINLLKDEYDDIQDEFISYDLSYSYRASYNSPDTSFFGVQFLKTPIAENDQIDNDYEGIVDEPEGEELGLTGWHYFNNRSALAFGNCEKLQYQIMAGDTTGHGAFVKNYYFFSGSGNWNFDFPYFIKHRRGYITEGRVENISNVLSCGPVNFPSGDTLHFVFAILAANSFDELKGNARLARKIVQNNYSRTMAPPRPKVTAVPLDDKVTLYWDDSGENIPNKITGYQDFEGYKIYRSTVDPENNQWGTPIYDDDGNLINFVPIASCDLIDGIKGYEAVYPNQKLGEDTGLFHTWTDTNVTNGVTYWYSVCSYNRGIFPDEFLNPAHLPVTPLKECTKGTDPGEDINLVKVTPGAYALNIQAAAVDVQSIGESTGNGPIEVTVLDPFNVSGHDYRMTFEDTTYGFAVYDLYDEIEDKLLFEQVKLTNGEEGIIFDGLLLKVQRYDDMQILDDKTYWYKIDTGERSNCTWKIMGGKLTMDPFPFEYDIRFVDHLETAVITGKTAPFEIWNTVLNRKVIWDIFYNAKTDTTDSLKNTWSSGDLIYIKDEFGENPQFTLKVTITEHSFVTYEGKISIPPKPGEAIHIALRRPFKTGDQFRIATTAVQKKETTFETKSSVKVVPNPYIVEAEWSQNSRDSRIQFINLPSECKIHIFSIAGDKVRTLYHNDPTRDYEFWDLLNNSNLKVSYGLYIFVVEAADGKSTKGKFVILR